MKTYDSQRLRLYPLHIRTAYADILGRLQDVQVSRSMASLNSCSLIVKRVGRAEYVYAQGRMADGTIRQVYLAPHDD